MNLSRNSSTTTGRRGPQRTVTIAAAISLVCTAALAPTSAVAIPAQPLIAEAAPQQPAAAPTLPATVSGDVLPAPQINGVAWVQRIAGAKVFVGGRFTKARPFGAAPGQQESARGNLLAYDLKTGALDRRFAPQLNGQVKSMAVSPDGQTVYVGGEFTRVGSAKVYRLAAFDTATGALKRTFRTVVDYRVAAIAVHGNTVYFGGKFNTVNGQKRMNLAAVDATTGALKSWSPQADLQVLGLAVSPDGKKVVVGGQMSYLNGKKVGGWGAVTADTGATALWQQHPKIQNDTVRNGITSVVGTPQGVYITGYSFDPERPRPFEGVAMARWSDGKIVWVNGTRGDSYDVAVVGGVAYTVSHTHDGDPIGTIPQRAKWIYQNASASTALVSPTGRKNSKGDFFDMPASEPLEWWPDVTPGTFTGTKQAAWTLDGKDGYLVMGGEFPSVNGVKQQGIARFAVRPKSPGKLGPSASRDIKPAVVSNDKGRVELSFDATFDRDDKTLTYELFRNNTIVATEKLSKVRWWDSPKGKIVDQTAPNGKHRYSLRVTDSDGNGFRSDFIEVDVTNAAPVNQPPVAAFTTTAKDLAVTVDAATSTDADGTIDSYTVDFGDGTVKTSTTPQAAHTYAKAGTYTVTVTVTDNQGATNTATKSITVKAAAPVNQPPVAAFTTTAKDLAVTVDAATSTDADGTIDSYTVDFGDGTVKTSTTPQAAHTYAKAGTYTVTVTVTDNQGATNTATKSITVKAVAPAPGDKVIFEDSFDGSQTAGLAEPEWRIEGPASHVSENGGTAIFTLAPRRQLSALTARTETGLEVRTEFSLNSARDGRPVYSSVLLRKNKGSEYRARVLLSGDGSLNLALQQVDSGRLTTIARKSWPTKYVAGQKIVVTASAVGGSTAALNASLSVAGGQPVTVTETNTNDSLASGSHYGLRFYQSSRSKGSSIVSVEQYALVRKAARG